MIAVEKIQRTTGRSLIDAGLFDRLVRRIGAEEEMDRSLAERVVDQALAFLAACAVNTADPLAPSELVDVGWHTFILHTRDYAQFCHRIAGRFIHHVPTSEYDRNADGDNARATLVRTVEAIERTGLALDEDLWSTSGSKCQKCSGCHNGCHDDPPPPPA
ncbi:hypothetical protein L6E12_17140 [Actinokineospora sp. PR83]|uniref:glycine-rich domain-containing protein n=1 Tax=Actinokineospora sp. PR83 TaxID=2884908 RepID=UPI0027DF2B5C|nr:hypothetical protein [Actinokineospora sp. PR83]MCG8917511.1 hypothetical protein [Actinokineospora sp. PR83]